VRNSHRGIRPSQAVLVRLALLLLSPYRAGRTACRRAICARLWAIIPHPTHRPRPASPCSGQRANPKRRRSTLIRPSIPARKRNPRRNQRWRSERQRWAESLPLWGNTTRVIPSCRAKASFSTDETPRSPATNHGARPNRAFCPARLPAN